jgi:DHA2 family multidrug resistance protein
VAAFATMCVGMFIALLDIQIVSASLRDIGGGLSAGADDDGLGPDQLPDRRDHRDSAVGLAVARDVDALAVRASAAGFTVASLLCGVAWNIQSMIAFRALQGFLGGSMIPMVFTTAFVFFQGSQRVIAAATVGALASLAPTLGPTVGGWITDHFSWHWLFFINLVPGMFVSMVVPMLVRSTSPTGSCCAAPTTRHAC